MQQPRASGAGSSPDGCRLAEPAERAIPSVNDPQTAIGSAARRREAGTAPMVAQVFSNSAGKKCTGATRKGRSTGCAARTPDDRIPGHVDCSVER